MNEQKREYKPNEYYEALDFETEQIPLQERRSDSDPVFWYYPWGKRADQEDFLEDSEDLYDYIEVSDDEFEYNDENQDNIDDEDEDTPVSNEGKGSSEMIVDGIDSGEITKSETKDVKKRSAPTK